MSSASVISVVDDNYLVRRTRCTQLQMLTVPVVPMRPYAQRQPPITCAFSDITPTSYHDIQHNAIPTCGLANPIS